MPTAPDTAIVVCAGLRRTYGAVTAVDGLDLDVHGGELLAVLGPSGCGKTTLLRLLAGFERPDAGSITVDGTVVAAPGTFLPPERRRVGIVVQDHALFPHLTVTGNVAYGLRRDPGKRQARVDEVLAMVGLEGLGDRYPAELSGGQQQRVAIARALAPEPGVILLDEPFANLDAALRARIRFEVRAILRAAGATVVLVTHDQEEALSLSDRLVVLRDGRVQQVGTPEELHARPVNWHVADFMGFRNLLELEVTHATGTEVAVRGEGLTLLGAATGEVSEGDRVVAAVRPEDVRVTDLATGENLIAATVEVVEYQGRELAVEVRTAGGKALHLRTEQRLAPGDAVTLTVAPQRLLVYPLAPGERAPAPLVDAVPS